MPTAGTMPWRLVLAGCIGMFAASATGSTRAPFLPDMARDLAVSLPAIANLFAVTAVSWGIASYIAGFVTSNSARRIMLIVSPIGVSLFMLAASMVPNYWLLVLCVSLSGLCCGSFTTAMLAEVSLQAPSSHHGRAFGYVMSGQSLTLLIGVPTAAWLGAIVGWRGIHVALAVLALFAVSCIVLGIKSDVREDAKPYKKDKVRVSFRDAITPPIGRLFLALICERLTFGLATFYYAAYLRTAYELSISAVAFPLIGFAVGNIAGTVLGGQVADRFSYRRISFGAALMVAGLIALPWFMWQPGLNISIALGVTFAFFNALARPPILAALADVPEKFRGYVMGLNSSVASVGWLTAALVGGWLYAGIGFGGFGPLIFFICLIGTLLVVPDSRIARRIEV